MRRGALNNLASETIYCPILLRKFLDIIKEKRLETCKRLKFTIRRQNGHTVVKNIFTLNCKEDPKVRFKLKVYE